MAVPCPLFLLLAACTPQTGLQPPSPDVGPAGNGQIFPSSGAQERFDALGQALERAQQRTSALQAQLDERSREIERLQGAVQQLRQHEGTLQTALDRATAAQAAAVTPAEDGQRPGATKPATSEAAPASAEGNAGAADRAHATTVASLRAALTQEQQRRQTAESELAHLKAETSSPPFADSGQGSAELAAAKREITELRMTLADERTARARLAKQLGNLERRAAPSRAPEATPQDADLRARLQALQEERQAAVDSFNRSLAASQERTAEVERQLAAERATNTAAASTAPAAPDNSAANELTSIRTENTALRERLDDEHRRTEQLAAKLKLATRVTDLIFKMQSQQGQEPPPVQVPRSDPWLDR